MSLLNSVTKKKKQLPINLLFYGVHGIGKSSFASSSDNPIFVGCEENDELDTARFPKVEKWIDFENQLKTLRDEKHEYKTLVIDAIDSLQQVAEQTILSEQPGKTMATAFGGYGKAYEKMSNMFLNIRDSYLKQIRQKGMNIILLCHAEKLKHEDPITASSWDHYRPSLHKKISPIFEDWVSAIAFANYYLLIAEKADGKEYTEGDGSRVIYTEERPSHVAKNRFKLPYKMDFKEGETWDLIKKHVDNFFKEEQTGTLSPEKILHAKQMQENAPAELKEKINIAIQGAKNDEQLDKIIDRIEKLTR